MKEKDYYYNWKTILLTILLYPIVYWKSRKEYQPYSKFCWEYPLTGVDENNVEINSFEEHEAKLKDWKLPKTSINKKDVIEYDLETPKGTISCLRVEVPGSKKWVIGLHGWTENKYLGLRLVNHFYNAGYNIITFDSFAHGRTYGTKTDIGYSTVEIIDHIIGDLFTNFEVESVGMIGNSMGASTAVFYSQTGELKDKLSWVIEDCGFYNLRILYRYYLQNSWSKTNEKWWLTANNIIHKFTRDTGVDHGKYDLLVHMQNNANTPIFFIHSQGDTWIPVWMSEEMYRLKIAYEPTKISETWFPEGSSHVHALPDYYDDYVAKTLAFAAKNEERK